MVAKSKISMSKRQLYFVLGMLITTTIVVFSFQWDIITPTFLGVSNPILTKYVVAFIIVLIGAFGSSLVKTAITGKGEVDL